MTALHQQQALSQAYAVFAPLSDEELLFLAKGQRRFMREERRSVRGRA